MIDEAEIKLAAIISENVIKSIGFPLVSMDQ
jgi:hypothetical protein